jgi:hypothetical protein
MKNFFKKLKKIFFLINLVLFSNEANSFQDYQKIKITQNFNQVSDSVGCKPVSKPINYKDCIYNKIIKKNKIKFLNT